MPMYSLFKMSLEQFIANKPEASELRIIYTNLEDFFQGEFERDQPNLYPEKDPEVVSWELEQGKEKNNTYGMFSKRDEEYVFPTGEYIEKIIILSGKFRTSNDQEIIMGGYVMLTAKEALHLTALTDIEYLCIYEKKQVTTE